MPRGFTEMPQTINPPTASDHPLGSPFSVPPAQGFQDLSPILIGISRDGGYEVVNASSFSARAGSVNGFKFGGGPVPGGSSGNAFDPLYTIQLPAWLTADYHSVTMDDGSEGQRLLLDRGTG